ncbi:hypothetical protein L3X38_023057 [Prunus dulcis]|uniref:Uncharacterized protein n=1 Tax=Prunus dulcis TaxID=3755 RepID=A0AAD4VX99_PRUDU|nr:hypothetical protein L3X38_023057 [Prunus dulcis]
MDDVMCILRYLKVTPGNGLMFFNCNLIAHNHVQHDHTKYVEVDQHFIKEKMDVEIVSFPFISSEHQLVDIFTKVVSTTVFLNSSDKLGMLDIVAPT